MRKEKIEELKRYANELKTLQMRKLEVPATFLSIEKYECILNNGEVIPRERILKNGSDGDAAIVVAMTEDGEFILALEPRVFTTETIDVGLPAGYIDEGEEPTSAAKRELLEETGYQVGEITHLGSFYQDQGCSSAYNHYFFATNCKKVGKQKLDEGEFIKYILVNYEELGWLIENNYIKGLNSAYAIEKAKGLIKNKRK